MRGWPDGSKVRFAAEPKDMSSVPENYMIEGKTQLLLSSNLNTYVRCIMLIPTQAYKIDTFKCNNNKNLRKIFK